MNQLKQTLQVSTWRQGMERDMRQLIAKGEVEAAIRFASQKALESYWNGLKTGTMRTMQNAPQERRGARNGYARSVAR
jgi:hypothetical protein